AQESLNLTFVFALFVFDLRADFYERADRHVKKLDSPLRADREVVGLRHAGFKTCFELSNNDVRNELLVLRRQITVDDRRQIDLSSFGKTTTKTPTIFTAVVSR